MDSLQGAGDIRLAGEAGVGLVGNEIGQFVDFLLQGPIVGFPRN